MRMMTMTMTMMVMVMVVVRGDGSWVMGDRWRVMMIDEPDMSKNIEQNS